jgi:hypothetical protein
MKNECTYRKAVIALLAASLVIQTVILCRIPSRTPTWGDVAGPQAKTRSQQERQALLYHLPAVQVYGVYRSVDVQVENDVEISSLSQPLDVRIVR